MLVRGAVGTVMLVCEGSYTNEPLTTLVPERYPLWLLDPPDRAPISNDVAAFDEIENVVLVAVRDPLMNHEVLPEVLSRQITI